MRLDGVEYSPGDVLNALNYGDDPLFAQLTSAWSSREDIRNMSNIWDTSLLNELAVKLYGSDRRGFVFGGFGSRLYLADNDILIGLLLVYCGAYCYDEVITLFPHSYALLDLYEFVRYLRNTVKKDFSGELTLTLPDEFERKRRELWRKISGTLDFNTMLTM